MIAFRRIERKFTLEGFYSAFRFDWNDRFVFNGESHDFWEAVFVESGEVEVTEDEKIYLLGAGDLILHAPMEFHRIRSAGGSHPSGYILSFQVCGEIPSGVSDGVFSLDPTLREIYVEICKKAVTFMDDKTVGTYCGQEVSDLLSAFLVGIGGRAAMENTSPSRSASEYRRLVSYMWEHVSENLTLSDVAAANNVSVSYVKQLFTKYAGLGPKSYFVGLRIRYATSLLNRGYTVREVSDAMNFSSPNYFSVFYKKNTGRLPSEDKARD